MSFFNEQTRTQKFFPLVGDLTNCDRDRKYQLYIATCYCTVDSVKEIIREIDSRLKLTEMYLFIDRRTALSIGYSKLVQLQGDFNYRLSIQAVRSERLFHTKAYCVVSYTENTREVHSGRIAIGSANLTDPGLTSTSGNTESLVTLSDQRTIKRFLDSFRHKEKLLGLNRLTDFSEDCAIDFMYAVLISGLFSHKWGSNLSTFMSVRYRLNEKGRHQADRGIATRTGFRVEAATISRSYGDEILESLQHQFPPVHDLARKFGIESFLGFWIPRKCFLEGSEMERNFRRFREEFFRKFKEEMENIVSEIKKEYDILYFEEGIINEQTDPGENFKIGIKHLEEDEKRLFRIWTKRHFFDLPYDSSKESDIRATFNDLLLSAKVSRRKHDVKKAFIAARESWSLSPLESVLSDSS